MPTTIKIKKHNCQLAGIFSAFTAILLFVTAAYANIPSQPLQGPSNAYADDDVLLSSVLDHMQYPLPQNVGMTTGNHLVFPSPTVDTPHPTSDQVRYIAAYRYCEHLVPVFPSPTSKLAQSSSSSSSASGLGIADYQSLFADRGETALKSGAMEECFRAMALRTSCPSASASSFTVVGQSQNCYTMQKTMCHFLKDKPPNGLGIDGINDVEADWALQNCDTDGLSPMMYDMIYSHRCSNASYTQNLGTVLDGAHAVEHALQFECDATRDAFEAKIDHERERMLIAIQTLSQLRGTGLAAVSPTSRPTGTGTSNQ